MADSVNRPPSPRLDTPGSMPGSCPRTEQWSQTVQHALRTLGSQNLLETTLQPSQSLPFSTPLRSKLDAPAVPTMYLPQSESDTPTSRRKETSFRDSPATQTRLLLYPPYIRHKLILISLSCIARRIRHPYRLQTISLSQRVLWPRTHFVQLQLRPQHLHLLLAKLLSKLLSDAVLQLDLTKIRVAYCGHHKKKETTVGHADSYVEVKVKCNATTRADKKCPSSVNFSPTHAMLDPMSAAYCGNHRKVKEIGFHIERVGHADRYVKFKDYVFSIRVCILNWHFKKRWQGPPLELIVRVTYIPLKFEIL